MQDEEQPAASYTIERTFLGKLTVEEFLYHIISSHIKPPENSYTMQGDLQ